MSTLSPARLAAYRIVLEVEKNEAYAHETLNRVFRNIKLDDRDKAFATRLAYGVIAYKGVLEAMIQRFSNKPQSTKIEVSCALQIALYEIFYEGQKEFAAVNQGVELVKKVAPFARGFANAILRRAVREKDAFPWGDPAKQSDALSRVVGLPQWLLDTLIKQYGMTAATDIADALNEPSELFAAVPEWVGSLDETKARFKKEDVVAHAYAPELPAALVFDEPAQALQSPLISNRHVLIMDAAAQLTVKLASAQPAQRILEIGAGRGNKSLFLASTARALGTPLEVIHAVDIHAFKSDLLEKEARRLSLSEIKPVTADATKLDAMKEQLSSDEGSYDAVLIDAPCTGVGTLRRHVDKRWRLKPNDSKQLAKVNAQLLWTNAHFVKPGGKLIYATCTILTEENEAVLEGFLKSEIGAQFSIETIAATDVPKQWEKFIQPEGTFQSIPEIGGPDGHFIAVMKRR